MEPRFLGPRVRGTAHKSPSKRAPFLGMLLVPWSVPCLIARVSKKSFFFVPRFYAFLPHGSQSVNPRQMKTQFERTDANGGHNAQYQDRQREEDDGGYTPSAIERYVSPEEFVWHACWIGCQSYVPWTVRSAWTRISCPLFIRSFHHQVTRRKNGEAESQPVETFKAKKIRSQNFPQHSDPCRRVIAFHFLFVVSCVFGFVLVVLYQLILLLFLLSF